MLAIRHGHGPCLPAAEHLYPLQPCRADRKSATLRDKFVAPPTYSRDLSRLEPQHRMERFMATALIVSALGALALTSGIALAAGQPHEMGDHPMGDMTRAQVIQMANTHFDRMDVNKDGKLDRAD